MMTWRTSERAKERVQEVDWNKAKVKGWSGGMRRIVMGEPKTLDIIKETSPFVWVTFYGREVKLRKTDFFGNLGESSHIHIIRPTMEFGLIEYEEPPPDDICDGSGCNISLPDDAGFKVEAECLENDDEYFEIHLCHECFGRIEEDWFKK